MISNSRPQLSHDLVREIANGENSLKVALGHPVGVIANRGYYLNTMGKAGQNDFGIYDDAAWLVTPDKITAFNWNTDASKEGWNPGVGKPYAQLAPGLWLFIQGAHKAIPKCFRQATDDVAAKLGIPGDGEFTVRRTYAKGDKRNYTENGYYAINIHPGGVGTTSSWGCQTTVPDQFAEFRKLTYDAMAKYKQKVLPYLLLEDKLS
jgi:lysozyme